jgi:hypothetical protein
MHEHDDDPRQAPVNILASSSRQWNPGDEFILFGIRNLFEALFPGRKLNWVLYDRNPDLFKEGFRNPIHKDALWTNAWIHGQPAGLDLAVVAGTPEWTGLPMVAFYHLVREGRLPLILLGAGYIDKPIMFSEPEKHCFRNQLKIAVVRDANAQRALEQIGVTARRLPCPALFASPEEPPRPGGKRIGFILQNDAVVNQSVSTELMHASLALIKQLSTAGFNVEAVCHYVDEFRKFSGHVKPIRYSYDARDYLDILAEYDLVITTRLHGAILANSLGRPSILLNQGDSRCESAAALFPFIKLGRPDTLLGNAAELMADFQSEALHTWKTQVKADYLTMLQPVVGTRN